MTHPIRFGDWVWDPNTLELRSHSRTVTLEPRVARLLEYLLQHRGELLTHDRLVDEVWDGRIVSNEAVRGAVFSLRQAVSAEGADNYIRTIHKKGYISQFPESVVENSGAEARLMPSGIHVAPDPASVTRVQELAVQRHSAHVPESRRLPILFWLALVVAFAAALAGVNALWQRQSESMGPEVPAQDPASIAVLPFVDFGKTADSAILADGLAEELLGTLSHNPALRVTARPSAFQFREEDRDILAIGQRLGVRFVLDGSVRHFGERVRIHTRLVDTRTGEQLWHDEYDRSLADWIDLQQVATEVARALEGVPQQHDQPNPQRGGTTNVQAQLEVLRARQLLASRAVTDAEQAIEHLQRALLQDPNYALAYVRLADAILIQAGSTNGMKAVRPVVAPLLDKALALDPGLGEAYCLRALLTDDLTAAEQDLRQGLALNPSYARGYELLANVQFTALSQIDPALASIDNAIALDPLTPGNYHAKAGILMAVGDWEQAAALNRRALELKPEFRAAAVTLGQIAAFEGRLAESIGYMERAVELDPRAVPLRESLVMQYIGVGDLEGARAVNEPPTPLGSAAILWAQGDIGQLVSGIYNGRMGPPGPIVSEYVAQVVLIQALSDRDYARALALFSASYSDGDPLPPSASGWQLYALANLVQLLAHSGDVPAAARLQEKLDARMREVETDFPRHVRVNDHVRSILLASAGRSEEACAALERCATPTPGPRWGFLTSNPAFDGMRASACFESLMDRAETHFARERAQIRKMRRMGQIPDRLAQIHNRNPASSP